MNISIKKQAVRLIALFGAMLLLILLTILARFAAPVDQAGRLGGVTVVPTAAADGFGHDAKIKNSSKSKDHKSFRICKGWSGTPSDPGCERGTSYWMLAPGEKSPWADADAVEVPSGYDLQFATGKKWTSGWHKVVGCFGCTQTFKVVKQ